MSAQFLAKFFQYVMPEPGKRYPGGTDAKSDLKLLLEIATHSRLKQGQDKKNQNKQIFYCRSLGKDCFKIQVEFSADGSYVVLDDYGLMRHKEGCEKTGESPKVIKIYNLMMLKRNLIEEFMDKNKLNGSSPEYILQKISGESGQYFYCEMVPDLESRRKLKKRFDNIINISIKKKRESKDEEESNPRTQKEDKTQRKARARKAEKSANNKENLQPKGFQRYKNESKVSLLQEEAATFIRPKKKVKLESNSSIFFNKNIENEEKPPQNPSQIFPVKGDSLFEEEQENDYFKKNSDMHIALNMLNDMGSNNYWPESDNSIGRGDPNDRLRVDDLFASIIRNSLLKSLERKSLGQIEYNITENVGNPHEGN